MAGGHPRMAANHTQQRGECDCVIYMFFFFLKICGREEYNCNFMSFLLFI
jgi:hypothetical protein